MTVPVLVQSLHKINF